MSLSKTLEAWLQSRNAWLLEYGPSLLALDPTHEKLIVDDERQHGLAIEVAGNELIPIFGLPYRKDGMGDRSQMSAIDGDLAAIVYDAPIEMVHAAIDSLAHYRASRRQCGGQWQSGFMRVPAVMPYFVARAGDGAELSYEEAHSTFSSFSAGAISWTNGSREDGLQRSVSRHTPGLFFTRDGCTLAAHNLWLGCKRDALLNLCPFRGPRGWHFASLMFTCDLPETIANVAIGRRLKTLVSYCLTDAFDLRIVAIQNMGSRLMIVFSGAEQLRRHHTLFEDAAVDAPFAQEVTALDFARQTMAANLSVSLLPEKWWQRFRDASSRPRAPEISTGGPHMSNPHWVNQIPG